MCLKENKDNLRTIICKILVAKRNKPDWNESLTLTFSPQRQTDQFHVADGTTTARWWARACSISNKWWCHVRLKLPSPRKRLYLKFPSISRANGDRRSQIEETRGRLCLKMVICHKKFLDPGSAPDLLIIPTFERLEETSLADILDLQMKLSSVKYIFSFFSFYAFRGKVGYFFLSKGAKFPGIFSSSTKTTEFTQSRSIASLFPSLFLAILVLLTSFYRISQVFQAWLWRISRGIWSIQKRRNIVNL